LFEVRPANAVEALGKGLEGYLTLGAERTMEGDPAYGLRQLVDLAERWVSPAVKDPTTAVQALDAIHDLLRRLAVSPFRLADTMTTTVASGVSVPEMTWDDHLDLAVDEMLVYGHGSQVTAKLRSMMEDSWWPLRRSAANPCSGS